MTCPSLSRAGAIAYTALVVAIALAPAFILAGPESLAPLMVEPKKEVYSSDFSRSAPLEKAQWTPRQGTRWEVVDGVLKGIPSSADYQSKKEHHRGLEPRINAPMTPPEFLVRFSVRFSRGEETSIVPFVEFGHHIARLKFSREGGLTLLADYESLKVAEASDFTWKSDLWYHGLAELKGDEFVVQFHEGPTLYASHPVFSKPAPSGGTGLGLAGPRGGVAELDHVEIWTVKSKPRSDWSKTRKLFPEFIPVQIREKPKK